MARARYRDARGDREDGESPTSRAPISSAIRIRGLVERMREISG